MKIEYLDFNDSRWKNFIKNFPMHNIFHSPEMAEVFYKSKGFEVFPLFATDENEILACGFPILVNTELPLSLRYTKRLIMFSTPLYEKSIRGVEAVNLILEHSRKIAGKKSLFMEIRNSENFNSSDNYILDIKCLKYIPYQNYLIDLTRGKEQIWNSFSSYTRNHIRKSQKNNSIIKEIEDSEIGTVVDLIENLYRRKNVPFPNNSLLFNAFECLKSKGNVRVIAIEDDSGIFGARMTLNYGSIIFDWYAAASLQYSKIYPNEALVWDTLEWGIKNKFKLFDFGGGAVRGKYYGPAKFKEKFKGELVEFGRYRYISNKLIYHLANKLYEYRIKN